MKIAVLGTGVVGQTLAGRLDHLGHEITVGTRNPEATLARTGPDEMGNPPYIAWAESHPKVRLATFFDAAQAADLLINATNGSTSLAVLTEAGAQNLDNKVLVDVANPLDFSAGMPPSLFVKDTDSLGEQIQAAFPRLRVVKSLNTITAALMLEPTLLASGQHTVFVSGNDTDAKQVVTELLISFGHTDVIDLGDISTARGSEMLLPIWLRLWSALGTSMFNFKVVR